MHSLIIKRSVAIAGHKTSVSLEDEFWRGLKEICKIQEVTLSTLISGIDDQRSNGNLSSSIRLFVLQHFRAQIPVTFEDRVETAIGTSHRLGQAQTANGRASS